MWTGPDLSRSAPTHAPIPFRTVDKGPEFCYIIRSPHVDEGGSGAASAVLATGGVRTRQGVSDTGCQWGRPARSVRGGRCRPSRTSGMVPSDSISRRPPGGSLRVQERCHLRVGGARLAEFPAVRSSGTSHILLAGLPKRGPVHSTGPISRSCSQGPGRTGSKHARSY
jgi:hypothetical protein